MDDKIHQLSAHIANQIAAGEVIQRPASAAKELLENAIDAQATQIQLFIKDAGKEEIHVIDNGTGMSESDALKAFDRHATSKIQKIEDLYAIRTKGFRGEALPSIASVGKVELRTRPADQELGVRILMEGSQLQSKESVAMNPGTSVSLKNLFYNIPARKHFLKSNSTELRHILEEFTRIALAHPEIGFQVYHDDREIFHLSPSSLKSRMVQLLGSGIEKNLVPVEEPTEMIGIRGFIGKPESATKTRGHQYFFINQRFVRSPYLHHAVSKAYEGLIDKDTAPIYALFFDIDPSRIDANVHPTKQEVKFEDEKLVYTYLNAAIRHALAKYNIAPSLDFSLDEGIQRLEAVQHPATEDHKNQTRKGYLFSAFSQQDQAHLIEQKDSLKNWKELYALAREQAPISSNPAMSPSLKDGDSIEPSPLAEDGLVAAPHSLMVVHQHTLITTVKSGVMIIHIQRAMERIWYERLQRRLNQEEPTPSQSILFPLTYEVSVSDQAILEEMLPDLLELGFELTAIGPRAYAIHATPSGLPPGDEIPILESLIEEVKEEIPDPKKERRQTMIQTMAKKWARSRPQEMGTAWAQDLVDELFACQQPQYSLDGKKVFRLLSVDQLEIMVDGIE